MALFAPFEPIILSDKAVAWPHKIPATSSTSTSAKLDTQKTSCACSRVFFQEQLITYPPQFQHSTGPARLCHGSRHQTAVVSRIVPSTAQIISLQARPAGRPVSADFSLCSDPWPSAKQLPHRCCSVVEVSATMQAPRVSSSLDRCTGGFYRCTLSVFAPSVFCVRSVEGGNKDCLWEQCNIELRDYIPPASAGSGGRFVAVQQYTQQGMAAVPVSQTATRSSTLPCILVRRPGKNTYIQSKEPVVVYSRSRQRDPGCVDVALESFMLHMLDNIGQSRRDLSRVRLKATACLRAMHHRLCDVGGAGIAKRGKACWR